ncbi:MAG: hypothetical protein HJJLKODD_02212 [Phycisphaerae bacterium]|nr:hypothetical protein [Phycisphaerae bacterium]
MYRKLNFGMVMFLMLGSSACGPGGGSNNNSNENQNSNDNQANTNDNSSSNENNNSSQNNENSNDNTAPGTAVVTFTTPEGEVFRLDAQTGEVENISAALNQETTGEDEWINVSPNGEWLLMGSQRFDAECAGWACVTLLSADLTTTEAVRSDGNIVHATFSAISSDGNTIVFPSTEGPHAVDLCIITRQGEGWSAPALLTGDSPHEYNDIPALSTAGATVLFDCGPTPYSQEGTNLCEVGTSGTGFREVLTVEDGLEGLPTAVALHHADYTPDGSILFEGQWDAETLWQAAADGSNLQRIGNLNNDNSPCVLPDGRIASLFFGDSGFHTLKIMNADGSTYEITYDSTDIADIGLGCGGTATPGSESGNAGSARTRFFPDDAVWYEDISAAPLDAQSAEVISWLDDAGGWGTGEMRIDFSIEVLTANASTPQMEFTPTEDFYEPDCDQALIPLPEGGALEGETGYECTQDGDCHLIVVDESTSTLYEMWRANIVDGNFYGGCLVVWDMGQVYDATGRGANCTSADAAGYPIAPLLFTTDEIVAGEINHAIRFILPNDRIRNGEYVAPATHSTNATSGPESAPPYGVRLRLRADYPLESLPSDGARVVARALQRYGMFLADGGQIALTARSDRYSSSKWVDLLDTRDLADLQVTDFEMVEAGTRISYTGDCVREP